MLMRRDLGVLGEPQIGISSFCQGGLFWGNADMTRRTWKEPALLPLLVFLRHTLLVEANRKSLGTAWQRRNMVVDSQL